LAALSPQDTSERGRSFVQEKNYSNAKNSNYNSFMMKRKTMDLKRPSNDSG
jgi:hypothetical protein